LRVRERLFNRVTATASKDSLRVRTRREVFRYIRFFEDRADEIKGGVHRRRGVIRTPTDTDRGLRAA